MSDTHTSQPVVPPAVSSDHLAPRAAPPSTRWPKLNYRWQDSWIIRAAAIASFILFCGYASSALIGMQSIDAVARLAYDEDVERALGDHLDGIKHIRDLQQALILERLRPVVKTWSQTNNGSPLTIEVLGNWIKATQISQLIDIPDLHDLKIARLADIPSAEDQAQQLAWLDRNRLKIVNYVVEFPKDKIYETFKAAEDVRQRYQLIGAKLDENIRPTLIRANLLILVISFLVLASLFLLYAQNFKRRISEVIAGFSTWSERDENFRFADIYTGELKPITHQFNAMADEVEANRQRSLYLEKIASWQVIARKLAHEIKNPLTPIQMMVSQLKRRYKGDDEEFGKLLSEAQAIITEEVGGLRRMVDNFSNFAQLPTPEPKPTDLLQLGRHVVDLQKVTFAQHDIRFESAIKTPPPHTAVDDDLIRQVLLNLIKNAGEACGETHAKIVLSLEETPSEYVFQVTDNGPGIPSELQSRIFEAYFTTKHTGPTPGMGLGLAVCQKIVMDHGGRMTLESQVATTTQRGKTVFTIALPKIAKFKY